MAKGIRGVMGVVTAALLVAAVGAPAAAAAESSPQRPAPTVDRPTPDEVKAEVAPGEQVTVAAAIAEDDGGMRIETMTAVGPQEAAAAVDELAAVDGAVAADVSAPTVQFGEDPVRFAQYASDMLCIDQRSETVLNTKYGACPGSMWGIDASDGKATGKNQVIAIIDSGVNTEHPELAPLIVGGARCMDGADCVSKSATAAADRGDHGSAVAGIANAVTDNSLGVAGIARDAKIMPVQVFPPGGGGFAADMAEGIIWAAEHGATVINVSAGVIGEDDATLRTAVAHAIGKNVPVVASAGNSGASSPAIYPASYPGVIAVGAVDTDKKIWAAGATVGSSQGAWVDVVAPGEEVPGLLQAADPNKPFGTGAGYVTWTGTSMSAPIVAAVVAAVREKRPSLTPAALEALLTSTAKQLDGNPQGVRNDTYGFGLVQPLAALAKLPQLPGAPTGLGAVPGDTSATIGFTPPKLPAGTPAITKYQYAKNTGDGFGAWTDFPNGRTASPVTFTGLTNGQATTFKFRAVNSAGAGDESAPITVTPAIPVKTQFTPIEPVRVFDSRWPEITGIDTGPLSSAADPTGRKVSVKDGRSMDGVVAGKENVVPVGATAVAYNITVFSQTASGFASVAPASVTSTPGASTVNWTAASQTMANGFVSAVDGSRDLRVFIGGSGTTGAVIDIVGYYKEPTPPSAPHAMAAADSQSVFVPISPARVYQSSKFGDAGRLFNTKTDYRGRAVQVAKAIGGDGLPTGPDVVPAGAIGIAYNVTITGTRGTGYLAIAPGDKFDVAPSVSVINWSPGQTQANATVVGVGANSETGDRSIAVFPAFADNGGSTHFIVDVVGYFIPKAQDTSGVGAAFVALPPLRAYSSIGGDGHLAGGQSRVTSVGLDKGIPTGASAVAFNLTITGTDASGYLSVAPGDTVTAPATSTINWSGSMTKANGSMVGVDGSRQVNTFAGGGGKSHYLLDIAGYYIK